MEDTNKFILDRIQNEYSSNIDESSEYFEDTITEDLGCKLTVCGPINNNALSDDKHFKIQKKYSSDVSDESAQSGFKRFEYKNYSKFPLQSYKLCFDNKNEKEDENRASFLFDEMINNVKTFKHSGNQSKPLPEESENDSGVFE